MSDNYMSSKTNFDKHETSWTGIWALDQVGNIPFVRIDNLVTLLIPTLAAAATSVDIITSVTALPVSLRPTNTIYFTVLVRNDSAVNILTAATLRVRSDGEIWINGAFVLNSKFSGTSVNGDSGVNSFSLSYVLDD